MNSESLEQVFQGEVESPATKWRRLNPEKARQASKTWDSKNPTLRKQLNKTWWLQNKHRRRWYSSQRRKNMAQATPNWVDKTSLKQMYFSCPPGYHVDHIIPINNPKVCGLNVPWNLQYLPAVENLRKGNKLQEMAV